MVRIALLTLLLLAPLSPSAATDPQHALEAARQALEIELRPAQAAESLRALLEREDLARGLRARARLELARCELALGDLASVERRLRGLELEPANVRSRLPGLATLQQELETMRRAAEPAPTVPDGDTAGAAGQAATRKASEAARDESGEAGSGSNDAAVATPPPVPFPPDGRSVLGAQPAPRPPAALRARRDERRARDLPRLLAVLDRRAEIWTRALQQQGEPGRVAALVSRRYATSLGASDGAVYLACTYSLEHATRDDRGLTRNDWDFEFGNGPDRLHVRMVTDDRSTLEELDRRGAWQPTTRQTVMARPGQLLRVHTLDSDTDRWFELQVLELESDAWVVLRWIPLEAR